MVDDVTRSRPVTDDSPVPDVPARPAWRTDPYESTVGWGLLVTGVVVGAAALAGLALLGTSGALVLPSSTGPVPVEVVAAAALEQGVLTALAAVVAVAAGVTGLGVLRSGRETSARPVLRVVLVPTGVVLAVAGLWLPALATVLVLVAAERVLRRR